MTGAAPDIAGCCSHAGDEAGAVLWRVGYAHEIGKQPRLAYDGVDGVDADVLRRKLRRHGLSQRDDGAFGAVVPG